MSEIKREVADASGQFRIRPNILTWIWFAWAALWGGIATVVFALAYAVARALDRRPVSFQRCTRGWARAMFWPSGVRVTTEHSTVLQGDSFVFVANHQNSLDIPLLALALPRPFGFVAKAELESVPFLGLALRLSPSVFVDWRDPKRSLESIRVAGERIRNGASVIVFPEGERTYGPALLPFKKSAFALAAEARVPVVPVAIVDAYRVLDEQRKVARPGRVHVVVGRPVAVTGLSRHEIIQVAQDTRDWIQREVDRKHRELVAQRGSSEHEYITADSTHSDE